MLTSYLRAGVKVYVSDVIANRLMFISSGMCWLKWLVIGLQVSRLTDRFRKHMVRASRTRALLAVKVRVTVGKFGRQKLTVNGLKVSRVLRTKTA